MFQSREGNYVTLTTLPQKSHVVTSMCLSVKGTEACLDAGKGSCLPFDGQTERSHSTGAR